nr:tRNA 2-thiouridine(34) synthase MnmA [Salsipaludibacter albus]
MVAMSGGVDSAVAAALLVEAGHDVTGVHLKLADVPDDQQVPGHGCCSLDDASDARRAAQVLDVPFYVWDLSTVFAREVQDPFAREYATGRTPNPCVSCNEKVKYAALLDRARAVGFDALATGHHVRLRTPDGRPVTRPGGPARLHRAVDERKDQSYVLWMATPDQLARSLFPVGWLTKDEVRTRAEVFGLRVATKPDSHDICFVPDGDTAGYLGRHLPVVRGEIVDVSGEVLGQHDGIWHYTVGQRRGLGLDHHERRFVVEVDATSNTVVVGPRDALAVDTIGVDEPSWTTGAWPDGDGLTVQFRAHGRPRPARLERHGSRGVVIRLDESVHGVARGQSAVAYDGGRCLGGGRITSVRRQPVPVG